MEQSLSPLKSSKTIDILVFKSLQQSYAEKFHRSPTALRKKLDEEFSDQIKRAKDGSGTLISDKTIRNFFGAIEPPTASMKTLNCFCKVLLGIDSYGA